MDIGDTCIKGGVQCHGPYLALDSNQSVIKYFQYFFLLHDWYIETPYQDKFMVAMELVTMTTL